MKNLLAAVVSMVVAAAAGALPSHAASDGGAGRTAVVPGSAADVMLGTWQSNMNGASGPGQCSDTAFTTIVAAETVTVCMKGTKNGDCNERVRTEKSSIENDMLHVAAGDIRFVYRIVDPNTLALVKTTIELPREEIGRRWGSYENGITQMSAGDGKMILYRCRK